MSQSTLYQDSTAFMVDNQLEELSEINKQSDAAFSARLVFVYSGCTSEPLEDGFACNSCALDQCVFFVPGIC